jgi:hypothetical protein
LGFTLLRAKKLAGMLFAETGGMVGGTVVDGALDEPPQAARIKESGSRREAGAQQEGRNFFNYFSIGNPNGV